MHEFPHRLSFIMLGPARATSVRFGTRRLVCTVRRIRRHRRPESLV